MSRRSGILSNLRNKVRRRKVGKAVYAYVANLINDPCVHCGEFGADSIDHIIPAGLGGKDHWSNYVPCHRKCNEARGMKGVLSVKLDILPVDLHDGPSSD